MPPCCASGTYRSLSTLWMPERDWMRRWRWRHNVAEPGASSGMMAEALPFDDVAPAERAESEPALLVDVDGFEGPLDLLLELARRQVDLHRISILALAEQYLTFVEEASPAPRACRRLPRDGGVARLSEVAASARNPRGKNRAPTTSRRPWRCGCSAWKSSARPRGSSASAAASVGTSSREALGTCAGPQGHTLRRDPL